MNMTELLQALHTLEEAKDTCHVCHEDPCSCKTEEGTTYPGIGTDVVDKEKKMRTADADKNPLTKKSIPQKVKSFFKSTNEAGGEDFVACVIDYDQSGTAKVLRSKPVSQERAEEIIAGAKAKDKFTNPLFKTIYPASAGKLDAETIMAKYPDMSKDSDESAGAQGDVGGAHGEETISPIHGGQQEQPTMENLDVASLKYLAGVKETIAECGMGMPGSASINVTASSGSELTGMLKDLMGLAGVHQVEPHHMPIDNPEQGHSAVVSAPPNMKDLIAMVDKPEADVDSMNDGEEEQEDEGMEKNRPYDNSPDEEVKGDGVRQYGDIDNNHQNALVGKNRGTAESLVASLFKDYENFVTEAKEKCCCKEEGKDKCTVHGKMDKADKK